MNDIKSISSSVETPQTQSTNNGNGFKADRLQLQHWFNLAAQSVADGEAQAKLIQLYNCLVELLREEHNYHDYIYLVSVRGAITITPNPNPLSSVLSVALKLY
jgi:hypothetical protein